MKDTWFDSDSLYKIPRVDGSGFFPTVFLEREMIRSKDSIYTIWNIQELGFGELVMWFGFDARTVNGLKSGVVSLSEANTSVMNSAEVVPNPSTNSISIETDKEVMSVNVYSIMGQKLYEWTAVQPHQKLSISHLPKGVYMVQYVDGGTLQSIPMVIIR